MTSDTEDNGKQGDTLKMEVFTMKSNRLTMNLQFFAEGGTGGQAAAGNQNTGGQQPAEGAQNVGAQQGTVVDYQKIQQMLEGTLSAKEDTALKAYFKQQGLSQQEVEQAITTFKQQKAANQPDVTALKQEAEKAQLLAKNEQIRSAATMAAVELGIDAKSIPYVLKMADMSQVMGQDGKINEEALKAALNKVLEDVPALKPSNARPGGFMQVGTEGTGSQRTEPEQITLKGAISEALKK